jgi:YesN/AraC family two-component response regulator
MADWNIIEGAETLHEFRTLPKPISLSPAPIERSRRLEALLRGDPAVTHSDTSSLLIASSDTMSFDPHEIYTLYNEYASVLNSLVEEDVSQELKAAASAYMIEWSGKMRLDKLNTHILSALAGCKTSHVNHYCVNAAFAYIRESYSSPRSLKELANRLGLSYEYLSREIKRSTGKSFSQILLDTRMEHAAHLLRSKKVHYYEIAELVGYPLYENFSKAFKKWSGLSPKEYSRKNGGDDSEL